MSTTQTASANDRDVETGKLFAILSYIIPLFCLVPLIQKSNAFAVLHARQAGGITLLSIAIGLAARLLPLGLLSLIAPVLLIAQLALIVIGIVHAARGQSAQLPIIGQHADTLLRRIHL